MINKKFLVSVFLFTGTFLGVASQETQSAPAADQMIIKTVTPDSMAVRFQCGDLIVTRTVSWSGHILYIASRQIFNPDTGRVCRFLRNPQEIYKRVEEDFNRIHND